MKAAEISAALAERIDILAEHLLGRPSIKTAHEWRYGRKGSFAIVMRGDKQGSYFDHEQQKGGDALSFVQRCMGGSVRDAMDWSLSWLGKPEALTPRPAPAPVAADNDKRAMQDIAMRLAKEAVPMAGTLVEKYLRQRRAWPDCEVADLLFHPCCPMGNHGKLPVMLAIMRNIATGQPQAIHRTALLGDGSGKHPAGKMMLGPKTGAAIMLCPSEEVATGLSIAEGIENATSAIASGWWPMWVAGDAGNLAMFPVIEGVEHLNIFGDADERGTGQAAARACAERWQLSGKAATVYLPPLGKDWNDIARERAA